MVSESHPTATLGALRQARSVSFGVRTGWLIAGLALASLLIGLIWNQNSVRYPGAQRQAAVQFQFGFQPPGNLSQQSAYQTPDDLPQVLGWYTQQFGLGHEMSQGGNCVMLTGKRGYLFLQQSLAVTLCDHSTRTLIFIDRSLAMR